MPGTVLDGKQDKFIGTALMKLTFYQREENIINYTMYLQLGQMLPGALREHDKT